MILFIFFCIKFRGQECNNRIKTDHTKKNLYYCYLCIIQIDKTLTAYPLDSLDSTAPAKPTERASYKIASNVSFFNAGVCDKRTLVLIMKKKGVDSLFRAYEPVCGSLRDPRNAKFLATKTGFFSKSPSWFKLHRVCFNFFFIMLRLNI